MTTDSMSTFEHKNKFHLLRVEDGVDLDFNMRFDENEMPKTFTTDNVLSMSMVEHSGVAVDVGDSSGIGPRSGGKKRKEPEAGKSIYEHKNKFHLLRVEDTMDLDLKMRNDENEMPKTFTTDNVLSMSMVEHSGVAVDVGDSSGIGPSAGGKKRKEPEAGKRCKCENRPIPELGFSDGIMREFYQAVCSIDAQYRDTELPEKTVTTTTGLNSVLRIAPLEDIIMDAVARCTDIQVEVSRLLNGYVIWMIEENRPIPELGFSDGIMREFYQAVCSNDAVRNPHQHKVVSTPSINEYMDEVYSRCRPDHLAWNDATKLAQLISNMARMHSTNCQNHVVTNILKWIKKWLIWKLGKQLRAF
ncbi:hypothetical protein MP638_005954 [Amoeboaphelidium occidentale]|nr:hypothetical protein MP638_005954 [Amoeboaphelidium occidentale]